MRALLVNSLANKDDAVMLRQVLGLFSGLLLSQIALQIRAQHKNHKIKGDSGFPSTLGDGRAHCGRALPTRQVQRSSSPLR